MSKFVSKFMEAAGQVAGWVPVVRRAAGPLRNDSEGPLRGARQAVASPLHDRDVAALWPEMLAPTGKLTRQGGNLAGWTALC
jgi:hypothetical protein